MTDEKIHSIAITSIIAVVLIIFIAVISNCYERSDKILADCAASERTMDDCIKLQIALIK